MNNVLINNGIIPFGRVRHCELRGTKQEAIQKQRRMDCFGLCPRNDEYKPKRNNSENK